MLEIVGGTIWIISVVMTPVIASAKGHNGALGFIGAVLLGPFALLVAVLAPRDQASLDRAEILRGVKRKCPACAELVLAEATKCRFCGTTLDAKATPAPAPMRELSRRDIVSRIGRENEPDDWAAPPVSAQLYGETKASTDPMKFTAQHGVIVAAIVAVVLGACVAVAYRDGYRWDPKLWWEIVSRKSVATASEGNDNAQDADTGFDGRTYEMVWHDDMNAGISQALAANGVSGCGQYKYKKGLKFSGEFAVYCTRDGSNWSLYLVWVPSNKVQGPHAAELSLN